MNCPSCGLPSRHRNSQDCIAALRDAVARAELRAESMTAEEGQRRAHRHAERLRAESRSKTGPRLTAEERMQTLRALYNTSDRELERRISIEEGAYERLMVQRALQYRGNKANG